MKIRFCAQFRDFKRNDTEPKEKGEGGETKRKYQDASVLLFSGMGLRYTAAFFPNCNLSLICPPTSPSHLCVGMQFKCHSVPAHATQQAILRRMPIRCRVGLPNQSQRKSILTAILRNEITSDNFNLDTVAAATKGFSGNDLQELCRAAAMQSVRQFINLEAAATAAAPGSSTGDAVPRLKSQITTAHCIAARDEWLRTNPALLSLVEEEEADEYEDTQAGSTIDGLD